MVFLACLLYYIIAGISLVIGYHRCLAHKSAVLLPVFHKILIVLALPTGSPVQWVGNHRAHHSFTDVEGDPHSPHVGGFWYAHCGWYIQSSNYVLCFLYAIAGPLRFLVNAWWRPRSNQEYNYLAKDIASDKFYAKLSKKSWYGSIVVLHAIVPFGLFYFLWGLEGVIALWITLVIIFNIGDGVDSFSHLYGKSPYKGSSKATNSSIMALLAFGDGWHADHHQSPNSAKLGFRKRNIDLSWYILLLLSKVGIAKEIDLTVSETYKK